MSYPPVDKLDYTFISKHRYGKSKHRERTIDPPITGGAIEHLEKFASIHIELRLLNGERGRRLVEQPRQLIKGVKYE
jgi:hypothetical protein